MHIAQSMCLMTLYGVLKVVSGAARAQVPVVWLCADGGQGGPVLHPASMPLLLHLQGHYLAGLAAGKTGQYERATQHLRKVGGEGVSSQEYGTGRWCLQMVEGTAAPAPARDLVLAWSAWARGQPAMAPWHVYPCRTQRLHASPTFLSSFRPWRPRERPTTPSRTRSGASWPARGTPRGRCVTVVSRP